MKKMTDYLRHAAECRDMARSASPSHKHQLEQMADVWEQLADARRRKLEKEGKMVLTMMWRNSSRELIQITDGNPRNGQWCGFTSKVTKCGSQ